MLDYKHVAFFDMDGTLTPPRKKITSTVCKELEKLSEHAHIAIVTGSPIGYLLEQCDALWANPGGLDATRLTLMPCNGTQVYSWTGTGWECVHDKNIKEEIGHEKYQSIVVDALGLQESILRERPELPITGNFLSYRGSLLNWCMIGRDASHEDRASFVELDEKYKIRENLRSLLKQKLNDAGIQNVTLALGGSTSIDIYPNGWSKIYALKHCSFETKKWFVGDKCDGNGNDSAIYRVLATDGIECVIPGGSSYKTVGPTQTIGIIQEITKRIQEMK